MRKCLFCYQPITEGNDDFHPGCSKKIFSQFPAPVLQHSESQMTELASQIVKSQVTVTGVQPKISVHITAGESKGGPKRFTVVGLWGGYILKPPSNNYPELPEVEDLTMHLAELTGINVAPHSLIRLSSGNLAYITKRFDRVKKNKLHVEDMCQLTERLTEDKYHSSYEQIAKTIYKYSANPMLDVISFFELVLFCYLTGNADMHLKNFSLICQSGTGHEYILSPAYDLVATALVNPGDTEELALTLNAKKKKIKRNDFIAAFNTLKLDTKQQENIFKKIENVYPEWLNFIDISFLSTDFKRAYKSLLKGKYSRILI